MPAINIIIKEAMRAFYEQKDNDKQKGISRQTRTIDAIEKALDELLPDYYGNGGLWSDFDEVGAIPTLQIVKLLNSYENREEIDKEESKLIATLKEEFSREYEIYQEFLSTRDLTPDLINHVERKINNHLFENTKCAFDYIFDVTNAIPFLQAVLKTNEYNLLLVKGDKPVHPQTLARSFITLSEVGLLSDFGNKINSHCPSWLSESLKKMQSANLLTSELLNLLLYLTFNEKKGMRDYRIAGLIIDLIQKYEIPQEKIINLKQQLRLHISIIFDLNESPSTFLKDNFESILSHSDSSLISKVLKKIYDLSPAYLTENPEMKKRILALGNIKLSYFDEMISHYAAKGVNVFPYLEAILLNSDLFITKNSLTLFKKINASHQTFEHVDAIGRILQSVPENMQEESLQPIMELAKNEGPAKAHENAIYLRNR